MNFSLFMARRFFRSQRTNGRQASKPAVKIATIGVAVGLAVMIITVCVVKGFQREIQQKITGFVSHLEVLDLRSFNSPEDSPITADATLLGSIKQTKYVNRVQRTSQKMGILKTETDFAGVQLKGIAADYDTRFLRSCIVRGNMPTFTDSAASGKILLSERMAKNLHLDVGSKVYAYFFENTVKMRRFEVAAIYRTNLNQFDKLFVITDLYTVNRLNGWQTDQCSTVEVNIEGFPDNLAFVQQQLAPLLMQQTERTDSPYSTVSVEENPRSAGTFAWLGLLNFNVWIILILMLLVAGFTMVSGMLILILERTATIGILRAAGATTRQLRHTFLIYASLIALRGIGWGTLLGIAVVWAQKEWHFVHLDPSAYYVDSVPVVIPILWIAALVIGTLLITMAALIVPSLLVSRIQPAKAIRFD